MTIAWHNWYVFLFDTWYDDNVMHWTWYVDEWNPLGLCSRSARSLPPGSQRSHTFTYHIFSWSSMMIFTQIFFIIFYVSWYRTCLSFYLSESSDFANISTSFSRSLSRSSHRKGSPHQSCAQGWWARWRRSHPPRPQDRCQPGMEQS